MILLVAVVLLSSFYLLWTRVLYPHLVASTTGLADLAHPSFGTHQGPKIPGPAVVCGGSIAGLLAAAVLARHFEKVVIVEPEDLPILHEQVTGGMPNNLRTRVAQYLHGHLFLSFSLFTYRKLFKDFDQAAKCVGARIMPLDSEFTNFGHTLKLKKGDNSCPVLVLSRDGLEPLLRRLVATRYPNITTRQGTITSLLASSSSSTGTLSGVRIRAPEGAEETFDASFVVDATGPTSVGIKLLSRLPAKIAVSKTLYTPGMEYRTSILSVSEKTKKAVEEAGLLLAPIGKTRWNDAGLIAVVGPEFGPKNRFGFLMALLEGDRALLFLIIADNDPDPDSLPTTARELVNAVRTIPAGVESSLKLIEAIVDAAEAESNGKELLLTKIDLGKSYWWDYTTASASSEFPQNFVVVGDAVIKVNPAYGSGATKAAQDAVTLDALLRSSSTFSAAEPGRFAEEFFKRLAARNDGSWTLLKAEDYKQPSVTPSGSDSWATTNLAFPFIRTFWRTLWIAGAKDEIVADQILQTIMMIDHPLALLSPRIVARVVRTYF